MSIWRGSRNGGVAVTERPTPAQTIAADPARSVWVTANAGTGKTRVLTNRVLRLLLESADPESILCITFTRAAAAEMAARIEKQLADWSVEHDEAKLADQLAALTGEPAAQAVTDRARRLFAQVLDLPSGLPIMTIHGFCQGLLRRFPLEAGIAPHFELIDERTAKELQIEARQQVLASPEPAVMQAIEDLAVLMGDDSLTDAIAQLLARRQHLTGLAGAHGGAAGVIRAVAELLEIRPGDTPEAIIERACRAEEVDSRNLVPAANALLQGTDGQARNGRTILTWLNAAEADRRTLFESYRCTFFTGTGEPAKRLAPKAMDAALAQALLFEQARLARVCDALKALEVARRTTVLLTVGYAVIDAYAAIKRQAAALDFDDLIAETEMLLRDRGNRDWVRFKLDARIDHLLVDEAQDTSPLQWSIIEHLVEEFHAGEGAGRSDRTLFVVGDEKQSIYSFQGADLASFAAVRDRLTRKFRDAQRPLERTVLDLSFRSGPAILEAVDAVLADPEICSAVAGDGEAVTHQTFRRNALSRVELWPLVVPAERPGRDAEGWQLPTERFDADEAEARLAGDIARTIRRWLDEQEVLEATGAPIRAGDILILLQRRGIAQERILKALKEHDIPVAGADRLMLTDSIAVEDLMALGQSLLLPEDDLTLAALLKCPLVGLDEDALFHLAYDRGKAHLFERLRTLGERGEAPFAAAWARFRGWLAMTDFMPPFELFTRILGPEGGRRRLLQRLGPDAAEPIETFLAQALAYEDGHPASLQGFLHWLGLDAESLKRDMERGTDAVRVMTVHGAKGLEAPIVFLAEAGPYQPQDARDRLLYDPATGLPLWRAAAPERDPVSERICERLKAQSAAERCRLFYVAMTRARDRLYVTGWAKRRGSADGCWHDVIGKAIRDLPGIEPCAAGEGLRLVRGIAGSEERPPPPDVHEAAPPPAWLDRPPPPEPRAQRLVQPSREEAAAMPAGSPLATGAGQARLFGTALHRLLHEIAAQHPAARDRALEARLARWPGLDAAARSELVRQVRGVLDLPDLAPAFAPTSRSEQPIVGRLGDVVIAGQIDRFAVTDDAIYLVDFKSNRLPPPSPETAPVAYLRQLASYGALLSALYPGRAIRAGLVWTAVPVLMAIPERLLRAHHPGDTVAP
jgi:ATP-dependent helicase/nuclease subunit A